MSEFAFPTYGEWVSEYRAWPWPDPYDRQRWDENTIFSQVSPQVRDLLLLPAPRDYYRPERAALLLGTIWQWPSPLRHGSVAFAVWMLRQKQVHALTGLMGGELCRGLVRLRNELSLSNAVELTKLLEQFRESADYAPGAGQIVAEWLGQTDGKTPLAIWLRETASPADEPRRLAAGGAGGSTD